MRATTSFPWKWKYIPVLDSTGSDASGALGKERENPFQTIAFGFESCLALSQLPGARAEAERKENAHSLTLVRANICSKTNEIAKHIADTHSNASANSTLPCKVSN